MNKVVKIIIIVVLIIAIGLGVFFIFFNNDSNLSVYKSLNEAINYQYNLDFYGDLQGLDEMGYGENYANAFDEEMYGELVATRRKLFEATSTNKIEAGTLESGFLYYYGYAKYDEILSYGIKYYTNYTVLAEQANAGSAGNIKSHISTLKSKLDNLYSKTLEVKDLQGKFGVYASGVSENDLKAKYNELRLSYRNYLLAQANLVTSLRDYIVENSFNKNFVFDTQSILIDFISATVKSAINAELDQEINYLNDASILIDKFEEYHESNDINYGTVGELEFVEAYTKLYYNDRADLEAVFGFTTFQKQDLLNDANNVSSGLQVEYVDYAKIICGIIV